MLKLNASYSKKIPAGEQFSSQSYHCAVEVEIPDGLNSVQLQERIHNTFELVRTSVDNELGAKHAPTTMEIPKRSERKSGTGQKAVTGKATSKQIKFLTDIAVRSGRTLQDLNLAANQEYGVQTIEELTRTQASGLIDSLKADTTEGRRAA